MNLLCLSAFPILTLPALTLAAPQAAGEVTCQPNVVCGEDWFGYNCKCANARAGVSLLEE